MALPSNKNQIQKKGGKGSTKQQDKTLKQQDETSEPIEA